jgi:uncharacterized protein YggE
MKKQILVCLILIFSGYAYSAPEIKGSPDEVQQYLTDSKLATIAGRAREKAYSDKAIISLIVTTEDPKLAVSIDRNTELRTKISKTLAEEGIKPDNIKTSKFSTSPQYGWFGKKPDSYKVINRMAITVFNENQVRQIAQISDENKEIEFGRTVFEHSEKEAFKAKLKKQALEDAMRQKQYYESTLGVKLTPVNFRDNEFIMQDDHLAEEVVVKARRAVSSYADSAPPSAVAQTFDEIEYQANISIDFKVGSKP